MDDLSKALYDDLKAIAARQLRGDRAMRSICPTDLANEALRRALDQHGMTGQVRTEILGRMAHLVRQVLVDRARQRQSLRRGAAEEIVQLAVDPTVDPRAPELDLLALDEALDRLRALDQRQSRMIEMRYFGGHTVEEVAEALAVSKSTVEKEERKARAWLELALAD